MNSVFARLRRFLPDPVKIDARERARSLLGVLLGLFVTGMLSQAVVGSDSALPWLIGPIGASAMLVFVLPTSPLAQPWPLIGGNVISALIGITCAKFIAIPVVAAGIAVAMAIAAMLALRCLHPPGGAVALGMALGGPAIAKLGYGFALSPVGLNSMLLLASAVVYNRLCGRRYPHFASAHQNRHLTSDALPTERVGISPEDLDAVLRQYNQVLDISRDDLEEILIRTEMHVYQRRFGEVACADIMSRDVVKVEFDTALRTAWHMLREHRIKALPVVDSSNHVIGIVTQHDFIKQYELDIIDEFTGRWRRLLKPIRLIRTGKPRVIGQIMTTAVRTALADQPIVSLVPLFSDSGLHHLPIVDGDHKLVGIVTQSDLIAALYRVRLEQEKSLNQRRA